MKPVNTGWHAWSSEVSHMANLTAVATVTAVLNDALPEHKEVTCSRHKGLYVECLWNQKQGI